ncbi:hypothetical protein BaRGS_00018819 [Batillaria attramentaria]|uniref:Uncharacterized protein n=1 Tax=Batillaria attramentaria TaxID=370345 RepID=A0ABD0KSS8_9CAEN
MVSERSCSTVSQAETVGSGSAKVVKPTASKTTGKKTAGGEDDGKACPPKENAPQNTDRSKVQPAWTKVIPSGSSETQHRCHCNKGVNPRSNLTKTQTTGQRPGSGSGIPRSPARGGNTPPSKLPSATARRQDGSVERPKPPAKQATFVKDSPSSLKDPKTPSSASSNNNVRLRTRSASRNRSQSDKRKLWRVSFGWHQPYKQIQAQRNAKEAPPALKRATVTNGNKQQQRPSNIARPQTGGTPPQIWQYCRKTTSTSTPGSKLGGPGASPSTKSNLPSRNNLNKSGSASSLRKAGSGSSLTKTSSGSSLSKGSAPLRYQEAGHCVRGYQDRCEKV